MRTCLLWIQRHPHVTILRHLLNTVNSFLCSFTNYFENRLLPNDLIVIRNHEDDEEDERGFKRALERQRDAHINVEIQSNSKFRCLTSSLTQSAGPPWLQIYVHDAYEVRFGRSTYARREDEINIPMSLVLGPTKIGFDQNYQKNFNIHSPTRPGDVHIKNEAQVAYDIQLGSFLTSWKRKEIRFPVELVPCPNSSGINWDHQNN
jgi:hypothetical protein